MNYCKPWLWPAALLAAFACTTGHAAPIYYEAELLGGNTWQYNYTVANEQLGSPLYEFTIYFDLELYANLGFATAPNGWDALAIQPDLNLADDGFFDVLALSEALNPGDSLTGFSVRFDYLGIGTPGSQRFDVVDPISFQALLSGSTSPLQPTSVPEPSVLPLLAAGYLALAIAQRRRLRGMRGKLRDA